MNDQKSVQEKLADARAEIERLKSALAAPGGAAAGEPPPIAEAGSLPAAEATTVGSPLAPAAANSLGEEGSFVASLARVGVLADRLEEAAMTLIEAGVKEFAREDLPPEWLASSGASGSGGKPPAPAAPPSKPAEIDWQRFAADSRYRNAPGIRQQAEVESQALLRGAK